MQNQEVILEVKDLHVSFRTRSGKVEAVRGVDFTLNRGETIAIVGESGSGKSVTMKTVMGILTKNAVVESGEIWYEGLNLAGADEKVFEQIRGKRIGIIFQDPLSALNPLMKIGKQIAEVYLEREKISRKEARQKTLKLMASIGIPDPDVLICDEPTTALDVTVQAKILQLIQQIKKDRGFSVIFITHDMGVVANIADRVYVMYAGRVVERGLCKEVFMDARHPYTWALLTSIPDGHSSEKLLAIPGTPPNMVNLPKGDAFAPRNRFAMKIDLKEAPPMFKISDTHYAATWLLHPMAPPCDPPKEYLQRVKRTREEAGVQ